MRRILPKDLLGPAQSAAVTEPPAKPTWPARIDPRLGPIILNYIRWTPLATMERAHVSPNIIYGKFEKVDAFEAPPVESAYEVEETVVEVPFGIVHLFRTLQDAREHGQKGDHGKGAPERSASSIRKDPALPSNSPNPMASSPVSSSQTPAPVGHDAVSTDHDDSIGTLLAMLNVPVTMPAATLLQFFDAALEALEQVRLIQCVYFTHATAKQTKTTVWPCFSSVIHWMLRSFSKCTMAGH